MMDIEVDRLSSLPDHLIHKILFFIDIRDTIKTSVLSSRWRYIWTSMPYRNLDRICAEFVDNVLSGRSNQIDVYSVNYSIYISSLSNPSNMFVKRILEYAFSHNAQEMSIKCYSWWNHCYLPLSLFNSQTLKHLTLYGVTIDRSDSTMTTWDLQNLTTLHLERVRLVDGNSLFVMCQNLKNLTLKGCTVIENIYDGFSIINSQLVNLTLEEVDWYVDFVLVDTPQLKNLIFVHKPHSEGYWRQSITQLSGEFIISSPELTNLLVKGPSFPNLTLDGLQSLEKVDLCISSSPQKTDVHKVCNMFQHLHSVRYLALSLEIVQFLSSSVEAISHQPSPFSSLKSLKIYPALVDKKQEPRKIDMPTEVKSYLLNTSTNATFTMISDEDVRAINKTIQAKQLMRRLQEYLQEMEAYIETDRAHVDNSCRDFRMRMIGEGNKTDFIFETLHKIKNLLTKAVASKRVEMQACLSSLCIEAEAVANKMMDYTKIQCDIKQSIFSQWFNEFASSS